MFRVMVSLVSAALAIVALAPAAAESAVGVTSAITRLDLKRCRHIRGRAAEDYGSWRCAGYRGMQILVSAGDQRVTVSYGARAARELAARQTLAAFNSTGRAVEWRLEQGPSGRSRPFATILRWNTTTVDPDNDDRPFAGQVLVVTRLGPGGVCHVGYVDGRANPNADELARAIAERHARGFRCGTDKPIVLGARGKGFSAGGD